PSSGACMPLPIRRLVTRTVVLPACLVISIVPTALAQQENSAEPQSPQKILATETYVRPPAEIERLVTAPRQDNITLTNQSPDRTHFLDLKSGGMPSVQTFGKPH